MCLYLVVPMTIKKPIFELSKNKPESAHCNRAGLEMGLVVNESSVLTFKFSF
jgi:hypothetical protein